MDFMHVTAPNAVGDFHISIAQVTGWDALAQAFLPSASFRMRVAQKIVKSLAARADLGQGRIITFTLGADPRVWRIVVGRPDPEDRARFTAMDVIPWRAWGRAPEGPGLR